MRDHGRLLSGWALASAPDWLIGAVADPSPRRRGWRRR